MSTRLTEWLSRAAAGCLSGDSRRALIRLALKEQWDLQDFEELFITAPRAQAQIDVGGRQLSGWELSALQRVWKSDFGDKQWTKGTFDFLSKSPRVEVGRPQQRSETMGVSKDLLFEERRGGIPTNAGYGQASRTPMQYRREMVPPAHAFEPDRREFMSPLAPAMRRAASAGAVRRQPVARRWEGGPVLEREVRFDDARQRLPARSSVPVMRPQTRACSSQWHEGQPVVSEDSFVVEYMGELLEIAANELHYVDNSDRVLVGWNGTTSPPCGRDGQPLVDDTWHANVRPRQAARIASPPRQVAGRASPLRRNGMNAGGQRIATGGDMPVKLCSSKWNEGQPQVSNRPFVVKYAAGELIVEANEVYYIDNSGRVLVGSGGSVSPPCGSDGHPLVRESDTWAPSTNHQNSIQQEPWHSSYGSRVGPRQSSNFWEQAQPEVSDKPFLVKHVDGHLRIEAGEVYYADYGGRVLVGWQGSTSPPCDRWGNALVSS